MMLEETAESHGVFFPDPDSKLTHMLLAFGRLLVGSGMGSFEKRRAIGQAAVL